MTELLHAVIHPERGALRHEHPGGAVEVALDGVLGKGGHAVAGVGALGSLPSRLAHALAGAVQVDDEGGLLGLLHGGSVGFGERRHDGCEVGFEIAVLETDAVDRRAHLGGAPTVERRAECCPQLVEYQAGEGLGSGRRGDRARLRHRDVVVDILRAHDATLDAFGEAFLADLECDMGPRGKAIATIVAGIGCGDGDIALRGERFARAAFLAHENAAVVLAPRAKDTERAGVDVAGAHLSRQVEDDLGDPGTEITERGDCCIAM